jgi:hypothetical protein
MIFYFTYGNRRWKKYPELHITPTFNRILFKSPGLQILFGASVTDVIQLFALLHSCGVAPYSCLNTPAK